MVKHLHIIGGGLAGLSAALHAQAKGIACTVYEATQKAGGRIRQAGSVDNGTHLIVEGYRDTFEFLDLIGMRHGVKPFADKAYHFCEPAHDLSWRLPANHFIWQVARGRIPGVHGGNILKPAAMKRLWEPFYLAVFNTELKDVPTQTTRTLFWEMLKRGPNSLTPYFCRDTLYETFVVPAQNRLTIEYGKRLNAIEPDRLIFKDQEISIDHNEAVVLALPASAYTHISGPFDFSSIEYNPITNVHFTLDQDVSEQFVGLIGTTSQWLYTKGNHACVTISNYQDESESLVKQVWQEVKPWIAPTCEEIPDHRIICEKKATPAQNALFASQRPGTRTPFPNVFLAGDWIDTGLPATIESAIRSGKWAVNEAVEKKR